MVKIRNTEDKILRVYTGTLRVLFIFTERYLAFYAVSYFWTVLCEKVRDVSRMTLQNKVIAGVIAFAEHLLESELRSDISQLVRYSGYSHRHLQRLFRNKTGMSVGDYLRRRRLTRAAILVRLTGYPLHDIAISVGFDSQPSFNREFRKRFGCSPGIYRSRPGWDLSLLTPRAELDETGTLQYSTGKCVREWCDVRVRKFISEGHIPVTHESQHYARVLDTVFSAVREKTEEVTVVSGTKPVNTGYHIITYLVCDDGDTTLSFGGRKYLKFRFRTSREKHLRNICTLYMCVLTNKKYIPADDIHTEVFSYREFFSFYCPPCYAFSQGYGIDGAIRESLPAGGKMVKYHADLLGSLGNELTRAWSVAMLSGLEEKVEPLLFEATMVSRTLKRPEDIRAVFVKAGMPAEEYELMLASQEVADMTEKQRRLFKEYGVTGTPSIYVNGRYHIQNSAFQADSVEAFRKSYVTAVMSLLNRKDK